ncbi:MAG TPA: hypothetical protein VEZ12_09265 [Herpetosiphonaceae bacterium]|nr:hypothetical protein [Herpetosiphonaceae bacterium]
MTLTTVLILCFLVTVGVFLPGVIGALIAGRLGRDRRVGFALGGLGSLGGWMITAILPDGRSRHEDAPARALSLVYAATGAVLGCANAVYLMSASLAIAVPDRFARHFLDMYNAGPPAAAALGIRSIVLLLWGLSWVVLLRDDRLDSSLRRRWIVSLILVLGAFAFAPWRHHRASAPELTAASDASRR